MSKFTIYIVTNDVNDKVYIGQTTDSIQNRFRGHCTFKGSSLYEPIKEIGKEHFKISVLDDSATNLDELLKLEQYYVSKYNSVENGYNIVYPCKANGTIHKERVSSNCKIREDIYNKLKSYSKETCIPFCTLLDKSISYYLENTTKESEVYLGNYVPLASNIDKEIFNELKTRSNETSIPISRLLDKALEMYLKTVDK